MASVLRGGVFQRKLNACSTTQGGKKSVAVTSRRLSASRRNLTGEASKGKEEATRREAAVKLAGVLLGASVLGNAPEASALGFKKDLSKRRRMVIPEDQYKNGPDGLKYVDIKPGTGAEAKPGQRVAIHFDCKWRGITFMTSRQGMGVTGGTPFGFDVGTKEGTAGGTLKGLDLGVRGMRVGGQRRLKVPPELAYGNKQVGEIPPGATLDIDVELLSIKTNPIRRRA